MKNSFIFIDSFTFDFLIINYLNFILLILILFQPIYSCDFRLSLCNLRMRNEFDLLKCNIISNINGICNFKSDENKRKEKIKLLTVQILKLISLRKNASSLKDEELATDIDIFIERQEAHLVDTCKDILQSEEFEKCLYSLIQENDSEEDLIFFLKNCSDKSILERLNTDEKEIIFNLGNNLIEGAKKIGLVETDAINDKKD